MNSVTRPVNAETLIPTIESGIPRRVPRNRVSSVRMPKYAMPSAKFTRLTSQNTFEAPNKILRESIKDSFSL